MSNGKIYVLGEITKERLHGYEVRLRGIYASKEALWASMEKIDKEDEFYDFCEYYALEPTARMYCRWLNDLNNADLFIKNYRIAYCPLDTTECDILENFEIEFPTD